MALAICYMVLLLLWVVSAGWGFFSASTEVRLSKVSPGGVVVFLILLIIFIKGFLPSLH